METTQEERRKWMQWSRNAGFWRMDEFDTDFLRRVIRDANDADRLAAIERQVLWRTEDMPKQAVGWFKNTSGKSRWCMMWVETASTVLHQAPDYRPDEHGPLFLPIIDPPE